MDVHLMSQCTQILNNKPELKITLNTHQKKRDSGWEFHTHSLHCEEHLSLPLSSLKALFFPSHWNRIFKFQWLYDFVWNVFCIPLSLVSILFVEYRATWDTYKQYTTQFYWWPYITFASLLSNFLRYFIVIAFAINYKSFVIWEVERKREIEQKRRGN